MKEQEFEVRTVKGHIEVYYNGKFFCSADSFEEAVQEIETEKSKGYVYA